MQIKLYILDVNNTDTWGSSNNNTTNNNDGW